MKKILLTAALIGSSATFAAAQVGINNPNPNQSAVLDLSSTGKGLLIPRMSAQQRADIQNPALGLMVYQNDGAQQGFWYYMQPGGWTYLNPTGADNLGNHTATQNLAMGAHSLTRSTSGAANMTALAYGDVSGMDGNLFSNSHSNNIATSKQSTGVYKILVNSATNYQSSLHPFVLTIWGTTPGVAIGTRDVSSPFNEITVRTYDMAGTLTNLDFNFVLFKP